MLVGDKPGRTIPIVGNIYLYYHNHFFIKDPYKNKICYHFFQFLCFFSNHNHLLRIQIDILHNHQCHSIHHMTYNLYHHTHHLQ
jgi:hypothetical protein